MRPPWVWPKIASETYGQHLKLSDAQKLPSIVTGVAESDLEKLVVQNTVAELIQNKQQDLMKCANEDDRVEMLLRTLRSKNQQVKELKEDFSFTTRGIRKSDVVEAIGALRRAQTIHDMEQLFPSIGMAATVKQGGLFTSKDKEPVPLKQIEVHAKIVDVACEVEIVQVYENSLSNPIEAGKKLSSWVCI